MSIYNVLMSFFIYGFFGWCAEVIFAAVRERRFVNRGFLNGPICPIYGLGVTLVVSLLMDFRENSVLLYIASVILVTVLEGVTGYLLEKIFHARWWDYSNMPLNIGGYVCPLFSMVWGIACVLIVDFVHPLTMKIVSFLPFGLGCVLLILFCIGVIADIYVTAASILKMNRRLAAMHDIAEKLHDLSDEIGENIFENVMEMMENRDELIQKYHEMAEMIQTKNHRILEAFPKIDFKKNQDIINYIKSKRKK